MNSDHLNLLFPDAGDADLREYAIAPIEQRRVLVGGKIRDWTGPTKCVLSPVMVRGNDGNLTQIRLGSHPFGDVGSALTALDAAVAAYDNGRGVWSTMRVADRIAAMQKFVARMSARRADVTRLIMREIGKTLADSEKEFDRTIDYVRQTIEALRNLDNANSQFEIVEGVVGLIRRTPLGVVLCMGPYNYPLNETFATLIPALTSLLPHPWGIGTRNNSQKRRYLLKHLAEIEYQTLACTNRQAAIKAERTIAARRDEYRFRT
jgi:glyceraldehyde-3-phosphate dehydrogenase (NADP+)